LGVTGGTEEVNGDGEIRLPDDICIPQTEEDSDLDTLIDCIFSALNANMSNKSYIISRVILSQRND
jgi:ATP-dependent DNA helicase PIF1